MEKSSVSDRGRLRSQLNSWQRSLSSRRLTRTLCAVLIFVFTSRLPVAAPNDFYLRRGVFKPLHLSGFVNTATPKTVRCNDIRHEGVLSVQESFHLDDDLVEIAREFDGHPMIDYSGQNPRWTYEEKINQTWTRLSGSSVWLEKYQVFLAVTRVIFYNQGIKHWPIMSFIRGQVYDESWRELKNHKINWQGEQIQFPTTYRVPTPFEVGGGFYGPEDPRIIIEEGVEDAEPVVVYNMLSDTQKMTRTMHIFRPFSNHSTVLTIKGQEKRANAEKNWAPFFYDPDPPRAGSQRQPNQHLHFIHRFKPLRILKCHLSNGLCDWAYEQAISVDDATRHNDTLGRMSGGTNFVQVPLDSAPGTTAFVGFPRTHIKAGCRDEAMYRPELMVMTASNRSHFHLDFMSYPVDFGTAVLDQRAQIDPCGEGRILIANSVARWDRRAEQDVMTIALSVADSTVQALRVHGIMAYIDQLSHLKRSLRYDVGKDGETVWDQRWNNVGHDVLGCTVEAAQNYSVAAAEPVHGMEVASIVAAIRAKEPGVNPDFLPAGVII